MKKIGNERGIQVDYLNGGSNIITVRENNLALIIRLIHKIKVCSRVYLAEVTGLKQATITKIVNDLISWGLVVETGLIPGRGKRRSIGISLNHERYRIIGIRLNRGYVQAGVFDLTGTLLKKRVCCFKDPQETEDTMSMIYEMAGEMAELSEGKVILGIGVAIPGPFVSKSGKIVMMSGFPGWDKVDIKEELERRLSIPVFLEHDANCGALAELWYGSVSSQENMIFVAADVGVGAGILINGQLYTGSLGTAGEIGHISIDYEGPRCECGNRGCLEMYCSTKALCREYRKEATLTPGYEERAGLLAGEILEEVANGEPLARKVFHKIAFFLGVGLANAVNAYNPGVIILSDKLALAGDYLVETVSQVLRERLLKPVYEGLTVRLGSFVEDSMLFGASALVLEQMLLRPSLYFKPETEEDGAFGSDKRRNQQV